MELYKKEEEGKSIINIENFGLKYFIIELYLAFNNHRYW